MRQIGLFALLLGVIPVEAAAQNDDAQALLEFRAASLHETTPLWGVPLWGKMILVDPNTRSAIATERDPDGKFQQRGPFFYGSLPSRFTPSNTSIEWGSEKWALVMLPLPRSPYVRIRLLAHESFHRLQKDLNLDSVDPVNAHLDTETGRVWLRMELRALARALRTTGPEARAAAQDAMAFRATRQKLHPEARLHEAALEIQEGLPEYTGTVLALQETGESVIRAARATEDFEDQTSFSRSFAYATGPALGLLLDRYQPGWRKAVKRDSDLSAMLRAAIGVGAAPSPDQYGYRSVAAEEQDREAQHQRQLTGFQKLFFEGPILLFPKTGTLNRSFNPNNVVSFGDQGTIYPTGTFSSQWGKLTVDSVGALLGPDYQSLRVAAPNNPANLLTGPGWNLELTPGWKVRPAARAGDFEVVPER
jgi:hypothetical protein